MGSEAQRGSPLERFDRAAAAAGRLVHGVRPDQLGGATPCSEWDVRALLNHIVGGNLMAVAAITDDTSFDRSRDHLGGDPARAFDESVSAAAAAFRGPDALTRIVRTPIGEARGALLLEMRVNELLVHGWDLARATGQPAGLPDDLAEHALALWRARLGDAPRAGTSPFAAEQPAAPDAPAADRLAAFLGRRVEETGP